MLDIALSLLDLGFDRFGHTIPISIPNGHTDKKQTYIDTNTPFQNLYQTDTDTDICFEIISKRYRYQ